MAGVLDTDLENWAFDVDGEMAGDLNSDLYDTVSYSEKSINESKGSRQLAWECDVDMLDDDCVEEDIFERGWMDRSELMNRGYFDRDCRFTTIDPLSSFRVRSTSEVAFVSQQTPW